MRRAINLNIAPVEQYPVAKTLTKSDMSTSQLVLPRHSVAEFIVPHLPDNIRERLKEGRANIWVVDDENCLEHFLTMIDRDHRYSIISWGHVRETRELKEGQLMRFGWMSNKLHFIVAPEEENDIREAENIEQNEGEREDKNEGEREDKNEGEREDKNDDEPPAKKMKDMSHSGDSMAEGTSGTVVDVSS